MTFLSHYYYKVFISLFKNLLKTTKNLIDFFSYLFSFFHTAIYGRNKLDGKMFKK